MIGYRIHGAQFFHAAVSLNCDNIEYNNIKNATAFDVIILQLAISYLMSNSMYLCNIDPVNNIKSLSENCL